MPGPAVLAVAFGWAAVPLSLTGPPGLLAASLAFYFLYRFRSLERVVPGHRGSRAVGPVPWAAGVGMGVALVVTGVLLWLALASATTTSAK
jgi:hypothetical protein